MGTIPKRNDAMADQPETLNLDHAKVLRNELPSQENVPWFTDGLRFKCTGCGKCCTGSPGYVFLSQNDLEELAAHFSLTPEEFAANYTYRVDDKLSLIDQPGSFDCIFLKTKQCTVYEVRPTQCRTFPWWIHLLRNRSDWEDAAIRCEGINHPDAPLVPSLTIQQQCLTYLDNLLEQNFSEISDERIF